MFRLFQGSASRKSQYGKRLPRAKSGNNYRRPLYHEALEDRRMLALLGVAPLDLPVIGFDSGGSLQYNSTTDALTVVATPLNIDTMSSSGLFFSGDLNINIEVDGTGALVGGVVGDDLVVNGDVDVDGDFVVDYFATDGALLTGEILAFGSQDSGGATDAYDYRFMVTGGQLASLFAGKDLGITLTSENSTFTGDFNANFGGNAKGNLGAIDPISGEPSCIAYDSGGTVDYNSTTDLFSLNSTPLSTDTGLFFSGSLDINFFVDSFGALIGGVPGDDFVLVGDLDADGDFIVDYSGTLLTGEITSFSSTDSGGSTDTYEFHFTVTGGLLAAQYAGYDLVVTTTSENSNFTGSFAVDFHGNAKGEICPEEMQMAASLSGKKYSDATGDGISGDDSPLANVTINLYQDFGVIGVLDGPDVLYAVDVTDVNGEYSFASLLAGNYLVEEIVPAGYTPTTPTILAVTLAAGDNITTGFDFANFLLGSLSGKKYQDNNGDGLFNGADAGLAGWTIELDKDADDIVDDTTVTGAGGAYSFTGLVAGTYRVREVGQVGWTQTTVNPGDVAILSGTNSTGNDFGNFQLGSLSGKKFTDITGNGVSGDDTGLGGVTINLFLDMNSNGMLDGGDGAAVASTSTAANGSYSFGNLIAGLYFVQEVVPSGYVATTATVVSATVTSGTNQGGLDFANFKLAKLTGKKYTDKTGNGITADDTALGGVTVNLFRDMNGNSMLDGGDGAAVASTTTASNGIYSFNNLGPGTYFVQEVVPSGYVATTATVLTATPTSGSTVANLNFANFKLASLSGKKFTDKTGNGITSDDTAFSGVTIQLFRDMNNNGVLDGGDGAAVGSTVTASNGTFSFSNLGPGKYFVQEVVPAGYYQTAPVSGIFTVTPTSGSSTTGLNFANAKVGKITGTKYKDITGNGLSADDTGLGGTTILLYRDVNNDSQLTAADGAAVASTVTTSNGAYSFDGLTAGQYFVKEVVPTGYVRTGPTLTDTYTVIVTPGCNLGNYNFANFDTSDCACDLSNVYYVINGTTVVDTLLGNTNAGDRVQVFFTVAAGSVGQQYTLVSYTAPSATFVASEASQQVIFQVDTGVFGPGTHMLEVYNPNSFYQIDFICGWAINQFGPDGSNIFYTPQGRLISADNDGTQAVLSNGAKLSGNVYLDTANFGVRDAGEVGVANAKVTLTGTTTTGQSVTLVRYTKEDGSYLFDNLKAGTYKITETQPVGFTDGLETTGSLGGTKGSDMFSSIVVGASANGVNYNFAEKLTTTNSGYSVSYQVDPTDSSKSMLVVNGTSKSDVFAVSYASSKYTVKLNGVTLGNYVNKDSSNRTVARLVINGNAGNDDISVATSVTIMTEIYGGDGNDRLRAGAGPSILVGGDGDDYITGSTKRDLIIGGNGSDTISGGALDDLVVAGSTSYDANQAALRAIFAEWNSSRTYAQRTSNILGTGSGTRANGNYFLSVDKVFDDAEVDSITGGSGDQDWFLANSNGLAIDSISGKASNETLTDIAI